MRLIKRPSLRVTRAGKQFRTHASGQSNRATSA